MAREVVGRNRLRDLACGAALGFSLGTVLVFALRASSPDSLFMTLALPTLILALIGSAYSDRIFDRLSDVVAAMTGK